MRVSDYIASFFSDQLGGKDIFMLSGAGNMHLTDGVPCMFISGNVKRSSCTHSEGVPGLRQFGVQE